MPLPVQSPEPAEQLEERFAFKGGIRLFLDETIVPVQVIAPRRRKYAMGFAAVAGAAGFRSEVALTNPIPFGSTILDTSILIHKITAIGTGGTRTFNLLHTSAGIAAFVAQTTKSFSNFPLGVLPQGVIQEKNSAVATLGTIFSTRRALTNVEVEWDLDPYPIILDTTVAAAGTLIVRPDTDNQDLRVSFIWSEPADPA